MKIDRYELRGVLGEGAMGRVYLAWDPKFAREVALKTMRDEVLGDERAHSWFHREARAMAQLQHPGIVEVHDYSGADAEVPFVVMERLHGNTLTDLAATRNPAPAAVIVEVAIQLGAALTHAHEAGIVHRDLKPDNVFVEPPGRIVVTDFGLARAQLNVDLGASLASSGTSVVGTPLYIAPEVIHDPRVAGACSDIYSVGILLYFLASQKVPYSADDAFQTLSRILSGQHAKIAALRPDLPPALSNAIERTFALDPDSRPESGQALAALFARALPGVDSQAELSAFVQQRAELTHFSEATQIGRPPLVRGAKEPSETQITAPPVTKITAPQETKITARGGARSENTQIVTATNVVTRPGTALPRRSRWPLILALSGAGALAAVAGGYQLTQHRSADGESVVQIPIAPAAQPVVATQPVTALPVTAQPVTAQRVPPPAASLPAPSVVPAPVAVALPAEVPTHGRPKAALAPLHAKVVVPLAPGTLKVNTGSVYADIMVNGEKRGSTPIRASIELPAGRYSVVLVNPDYGTHEYQVVIEAGQTKLLKAALDR